jgi:hypothetical protein
MWTWQTRIAASRWRKFATTAHLAHIAPALPNPPWTQDPADAPWTLPRADALDKACMWAAGTKFPDHSAAAIAVAINNIPHQEYGLEATLITMDWEFRLTHYLTQVDGAAPFTVNCKDISSALMTFANLLGANLWPLSIGSGFWSNNVSALNDPNFIAHEWGNHEVAAKESTFPQAFAADLVLTPPGEDEPVQIYDACLKLNGDNVPPMDMLFGSVGSGAGYRFRLIDSRTGNGIPSKPKARRPVL